MRCVFNLKHKGELRTIDMPVVPRVGDVVSFTALGNLLHVKVREVVWELPVFGDDGGSVYVNIYVEQTL